MIRRTRKPDLPIYSLYGETRRPKPEHLKGLDAIVFDIQDIGVRFYTYETTLLNVMEEAAKAKIPVFVLDRTNPINGMTRRRRNCRHGQIIVRRFAHGSRPARFDDWRTGANDERGKENRRGFKNRQDGKVDALNVV
ncbi:MAG: exo-beta-N-acetylmuramidase NamZ domain-containing protein [Pyrinomonadaceae bacterium]